MLSGESLLGLFLEDPINGTSSTSSILPPHSAMQCQQIVEWGGSPSESMLGFIPEGSGLVKSYVLGVDQPTYRIVIEGKSQECLAQDTLYPTQTIWVHSIIRWIRPCVAKQPIKLSRPPVPGSIWWHDSQGHSMPLPDEVWSMEHHQLTVSQSGFVSYAPIFKTWVQSLSVTTQEWTFQSQWRLELQEWPAPKNQGLISDNSFIN